MSLDLKLNSGEFNLSLVKPSVPRSYEFENFRLEVEHLMLYKNGEEVPLTPKQVDTLLALIERGGEIVSKEVLMSRLWGTTAVEESNLVQNIHFLRKALGKTSDGVEMIETLRRRGYRFNAKVDTDRPRRSRTSTDFRPEIVNGFSEESVAAVAIAPVLAKDAKRGFWWKLAAGGLGIGILMSLALVAAYLVFGPRSLSNDGRKTLAVLPIKPIKSTNRDEIYEIGIADALIHYLSASKNFTVRPISSTRRYVDIDQDPATVGRELRVDYVLSSTYQVVNGQIRVSSQLISVSTGRAEDTFQTTEDTADIFLMQDFLAGRLGGHLLYHDSLAPNGSDFQWKLARFGTGILGHSYKRTSSWLGTHNHEAYRHYLQAMNLSDENSSPNNLNKALAQLEQSVKVDPNFGLSWAGIALLHRDMAVFTDSDSREHYEESMEALNRAIAIDPTISDAYSARCSNKHLYEYDFSGAEADCKRAIELDASSPVAHRIYANLLYSRGRFDEALNAIQTAIALQPIHRNQEAHGLALFYSRRYGEAEAQFKQLLESSPDNVSIHANLTKILEKQGKESDAFESFIKKLHASKSDTETIDRFKSVYKRSGWRGVTVERIKSMEKEARPDYFQLACLYAKVGDKDRALEYLEKAYQERNHSMPTVQIEPQLDEVRKDPRYMDLIKRLDSVVTTTP